MNDRPIAANDRILAALIRADAEARDREVERLIVEVALPLVTQILSRYGGSRSTLSRTDADDVAGTVSLRLVEKLRRVATSPGDAIEDFPKYVATVTFNVVTDWMRSRFPERTRLKNRIRYVAMQDPRLAVWTTSAGSACGLSAAPRAEIVANEIADTLPVTRAMRDRARTADAIVAILTAVGQPVSLDALTAFTAKLWGVDDAGSTDVWTVESSHPTTVEQLESRQFLQRLWDEIRQLPPPQRKALLLNLRDTRTVDVTSLVIVTGTAAFDDVAKALEMTPSGLAAIWKDLPLDDLRIAAMLGVTRQQVINLRKAARVRLARRMRAQ